MRRASKVDDNQGAIVECFRAHGCSVHLAHAAGEGFPDLVIGMCGVTTLVEVKDPDKPPSARKLTPAQVRFHGAWKGSKFVVMTDDDVAAVVAWMRRHLTT